MLKDVQCEHHWLHDTHQADSPILAKRVPALHCQWFCNSFCYLCIRLIHLSRNRGHRNQSFHKSPQKEIAWCEIWRNRTEWDLNELNTQITEAVATIDNAMLGRVWQELDYRLDVCCVTNGAHIEHLSTFYVKIEVTSFLNLPDVFLYP